MPTVAQHILAALQSSGDRRFCADRPEYVAGVANRLAGDDTVLPFDVRQELSIPPAISAEQAKGFTLYAIRTILAGRADELLDLVSTNVARRILD